MDGRDWTILELQGTLESRVGDCQGLEIGTLEIKEGTPILLIGNHRLEGKVVQLSKPFVVMENRPPGASLSEGVAPEDAESGTEDNASAEKGVEELAIVGVVKTKYLFG